MKAHITVEPKALLLWAFGPEQRGYEKVLQVAARWDLKVRQVGYAELSALVGDLCAGKPAPDYAVLPALPNTPVVIISGLLAESGEANEFLKALAATGAELPVKALVTPTSKKWSLLQLLQELFAEHQAHEDGLPAEGSASTDKELGK